MLANRSLLIQTTNDCTSAGMVTALPSSLLPGSRLECTSVFIESLLAEISLSSTWTAESLANSSAEAIWVWDTSGAWPAASKVLSLVSWLTPAGSGVSSIATVMWGLAPLNSAAMFL